ncbi:hypothetical protein BpHYR1_013858 [Brachionus plicatilis]|uniref:Uncharacterized protein n=1 Tax=Brachionus plicatilis TaxID=10195 RepID=A0A3M7SAQ7_BRAPC|nr:hypothetical protein BpHYR1_013858 [Brachionus plicatilis]
MIKSNEFLRKFIFSLKKSSQKISVKKKISLKKVVLFFLTFYKKIIIKLILIQHNEIIAAQVKLSGGISELNIIEHKAPLIAVVEAQSGQTGQPEQVLHIEALSVGEHFLRQIRMQLIVHQHHTHHLDPVHIAGHALEQIIPHLGAGRDQRPVKKNHHYLARLVLELQNGAVQMVVLVQVKKAHVRTIQQNGLVQTFVSRELMFDQMLELLGAQRLVVVRVDMLDQRPVHIQVPEVACPVPRAQIEVVEPGVQSGGEKAAVEPLELGGLLDQLFLSVQMVVEGRHPVKDHLAQRDHARLVHGLELDAEGEELVGVLGAGDLKTNVAVGYFVEEADRVRVAVLFDERDGVLEVLDVFEVVGGVGLQRQALKVRVEAGLAFFEQFDDNFFVQLDGGALAEADGGVFFGQVVVGLDTGVVEVVGNDFGLFGADFFVEGVEARAVVDGLVEVFSELAVAAELEVLLVEASLLVGGHVHLGYAQVGGCWREQLVFGVDVLGLVVSAQEHQCAKMVLEIFFYLKKKDNIVKNR